MRQGVKLPALLALACLASIVALVIAAYVPSPLSTLDANAVESLSALQGPIATPLLGLIARTGDPAPLGLMLAALVALGVALGRRRPAVVAAVAVVGANVATQVLKVVLAHPRIYPVLGPHQLAPTAFPSGHATAAMSIALAAVIVSPPSWRRWAAPLAAGYALSVATAILVLEWHFPSDVLGGFLVAAGFAFGCVAVARALGARDASARPSLPSAVAVPPVPMVVVGAAALAAMVLTRYDDLVEFARAHTTGFVALAGVMSACAILLAGVTKIADR